MSSDADPLRIAVNAQLPPGGGAGGVEQVLAGLIHAFGRLEDGAEEYVIVGPWQKADWLNPYLGPNQRLVAGPQPQPSAALTAIKRLLGPLGAPTSRLWRRLRPFLVGLTSPKQPTIPVSDGFYESLDADVVHFPYQHFARCQVPTIYNPHDLQHIHFPEHFEPQTISWRETIYPAGCRIAHTVAVASEWVKRDIVRHYGLEAAKIQVIPWAPSTEALASPTDEQVARVKAAYHLDKPFAFYPAATWQHKNHLRLLDALARLRDREGMVVRLVCTGHRYPGFWPRIKEHLDALDLNDQVRFLGMVPYEEVRAIYRLSEFVVVPTLFEAASGPVFEAWHEGTPVACSSVTSLPQQVGDAAMLFEPYSVEAIANAVRCMARDESIRADLAHKGLRRLRDFSWERTAKAYRAVYRRAAGRLLTDEDRSLLAWDWMRDPIPPRQEA